MDISTAYITAVFVLVSFGLGGAVGTFTATKPVVPTYITIQECEQQLPRDMHCKMVAVVEDKE